MPGASRLPVTAKQQAGRQVAPGAAGSNRKSALNFKNYFYIFSIRAIVLQIIVSLLIPI